MHRRAYLLRIVVEQESISPLDPYAFDTKYEGEILAATILATDVLPSTCFDCFGDSMRATGHAAPDCHFSFADPSYQPTLPLGV